jgi:hypothetical protein
MTDTAQMLHDLKTARATIIKPEWWTKRAFGRTSEGDLVPRGSFKEQGAVCFCAAGAAWIAVGDPITFEFDSHDYASQRQRYHAVMKELAKELNSSAELDHCSALDIVANFNDNHTHAEVIDLYDRVIKRLETQ